MKTLQLADPTALSAAAAVLVGPQPVLMLELPTVFALVAPPTAAGAAALDAAKRRMPGKTYGSLIGSLDRFRQLARTASLPPWLRAPGALQVFEGGFMRVQVGESGARTPTVSEGTHQGLLLEDGPHRAFVCLLEARLRELAEPEMFCGGRCAAPLATSANWSGDPDGSITEWGPARAFAQAVGLPLVIRCEPVGSSSGSYPIFQLGPHGVSLERPGPRDAQIRARVDAAEAST